MTVTQTQWKVEAFVRGGSLDYDATFDMIQLAILEDGLIPQSMDNKWFVYFEEPFLFFHRNWTGEAFFRLKLKSTPSGAAAEEVLISSSYAQAKVDALERVKLLDSLISSLPPHSGK